jgi:hypothetical protein
MRYFQEFSRSAKENYCEYDEEAISLFFVFMSLESHLVESERWDSSFDDLYKKNSKNN